MINKPKSDLPCKTIEHPINVILIFVFMCVQFWGKFFHFFLDRPFPQICYSVRRIESDTVQKCPNSVTTLPLKLDADAPFAKAKHFPVMALI
ncbi:hypothetical protein HUJ05_001498 [Dendroctonus ponderosae]|nr:hypothetical protein HUJ05_001498 [Dendroctonus ponderosae]